MSFTFTPKTEQEVLNLLPEGEYDFYVKSAENAISKKGNPMIRIVLAVHDSRGCERLITDYLMEAMMYKLKHFCDATGLEDKYQTGSFTDKDCLNRNGRCVLKIEESVGYSPRNSVKDYCKPVTNAASEVEKDNFTDTDIPF